MVKLSAIMIWQVSIRITKLMILKVIILGYGILSVVVMVVLCSFGFASARVIARPHQVTAMKQVHMKQI